MSSHVFGEVAVKLTLAACVMMLGSTFIVPAAYAQGSEAKANKKFEATGPIQPVKLERSQFKGAVKVTFDLLPTTMSFDLPWNYCMVTQNGIKFSTLAAETYDPRDFAGTGGAASFEPGMDREGRYVRAWIEHQSDARIVVRIRYALANNLYDIAFPDIPSGSPYGKGDWVDEWFYIYPDGVHTRHMKIYSGLAPVSRPFGFDREPPNVVHEFMELNVRGLPGHKPTDDIEIEAMTLIRLLRAHTEYLIEEGISTTISYKPYPVDFGEFRDASIMLLNLKSEYKPFTIGMPYGVRVQPYSPEDDLPHVFQTWGYSEERGYTSSLGHMLNFWHYRRTDNTLEQVYLHGMTDAEDPKKELVDLAWSWTVAPRLRMEGFESDYGVYTYDIAQKAYIVPRTGRGATELEFEFGTNEDRDAPFRIINPAFIVKDWDEPGVELKVDDKRMKQGPHFRVGYEQTPTGKDLVIWLKMKTNKAVTFSIAPQ
jgi:hypothetical protein